MTLSPFPLSEIDPVYLLAYLRAADLARAVPRAITACAVALRMYRRDPDTNSNPSAASSAALRLTLSRYLHAALLSDRLLCRRGPTIAAFVN
jgi:hypothetical protein